MVRSDKWFSCLNDLTCRVDLTQKKLIMEVRNDQKSFDFKKVVLCKGKI